MSDKPALKSPFKMEFKCFLAFNRAITPLQEVHVSDVRTAGLMCARGVVLLNLWN